MIIRVLDAETCGFPKEGDGQIVEVATVDLELRSADGDALPSWQRGRMWTSLVNPSREIPATASAVHHITDEMVADAPRFTDLLPSIREGEPGIYAAHNARFERACWLASCCQPVTAEPMTELPEKALDPSPPPSWIDTYKCAIAMWPDAPSHSNQVLRYWLGLKLAEGQDVVPHRALGDAYVTAALLRRMLGLGVEQLLDCSLRPALLPKFRFGKHAMVPLIDVPLDYLDWVVKNVTDDEDVQYTARYYLQSRRAASRARSPV
jgi:exodeoxyribonuclease X